MTRKQTEVTLALTALSVLAFAGTAAADHYVIVGEVTENETERPSPMLLHSNVTFEVKFDRVADSVQGIHTHHYDATINLTWTESNGTVHTNQPLANETVNIGDNFTGSQVNITGETQNAAGHLVRCGVNFVSATRSDNIPTLKFGNNALVAGTCFDLDPDAGNSDYVIRTITNHDGGASAAATAADVAAAFADVDSLIGTPSGSDGLAGMIAIRSTASDVTAARDVVTGALTSAVSTLEGSLGGIAANVVAVEGGIGTPLLKNDSNTLFGVYGAVASAQTAVTGEVTGAVSTLQGDITAAQNNVITAITASQDAIRATLVTSVPLYNDPTRTVAFPTSMLTSLEATMTAGAPLPPGAQVPSNRGGYFDALPFLLSRNLAAVGTIPGANASKLKNAATDLSLATTFASQGKFGSAAAACAAGLQQLSQALP